MKRILHVGMSDNLGGIEVFLINFYRKLDKTLFQFDFINMYDGDLCFQNEIEDYGGKVFKIPNEKKHPFKFKKELKKIIDENNYEIVHVHKNSLAFIEVLKVLKKSNVKVKIIHSHNTQSSQPSLLINILHNFNKIIVKKYCDYFFACSKEAGSWMFSNNIVNSEKFIVINNAIDITKFKYNINVRNNLRKELNISDDIIVLGHVGRFTTQKNHSFLIDLFKKIHDKNEKTILVLVGQGDLMKVIRDKVESLGLSDFVKFVGQKNNVNDYYQIFDFFVIPSIYEGLGIVLIEAQASGLPCLASTEVPRIAKVTDNVKFIDLNSDLNEWVYNYELLLNNCNRINSFEEISKNGFNIDYEIKKLESMYTKYTL